MSERKRLPRTPVEGGIKVDTNISFTSETYNALADEARRRGVSMSSIILEALSMRKRVMDLGLNIVLATKDSNGQLLELGPISILR